MNKLIDFSLPYVKKLLKTLLKDRTTGNNIIFATDAYENATFTTEMKAAMLYNDTIDIRPRVSKSMEEQALRTRKKAEVFTPSWICNKMNNHCDTEWFGCEKGFQQKNRLNFRRESLGRIMWILNGWKSLVEKLHILYHAMILQQGR